MATPTLDVFVLTFNCGKAPVDANVFARHLRSALSHDVEVAREGAGELNVDPGGPAEPETRANLPDLVVL